MDFSDTWFLVGGSWQFQSAASGCLQCPGGRSLAGLADDPSVGGLLMFGGYPYRGDTWSLVRGLWSPFAFSNAPGPRWDASMAWDPSDHVVVLFGGSDGTTLGDTWTYSQGVWTEVISSAQCLASTCPSPRAGASLGWDGVNDTLILFGGMSTTTGGYLRDTWSFSANSWTELIAGGSCTSTTCPSARSNASIAWDASDQELVLFGGVGTGYDNDTWVFYGGAWQEVLSPSQCATRACPSPRASAGMSQGLLTNGGVLLFGGVGATGMLNDTWSFQGGAWTSVENASYCARSHCPSVRAGAGIALDPTGDVVVLFGGAGATRMLSDTWVYDGVNWTSQSLYGPSGRGYASLAYTGQGDNLLLFGGSSRYGPITDTWMVGTPWTALTPTASPTTIDLGESVQISAAASGGGVSAPWYSWQGLPPGCATPANGAASVACTPATNGTFFVTDVVSSGNGLPGVTSNFLSLNVNTDPVVVLSLHPSQIPLGNSVTLWANASGGSGTFSSIAWFGLPANCTAAPGPTNALTCTPNLASDLGTWQIHVSAMDGTGFNVTSAPVTLTIGGPDWSVGVSVSLSQVDVLQYLTLAAAVTGYTGALNFTWSGLPPGCAGTLGSIMCQPTTPGTYSITVTGSGPVAGSITSPPTVVTVYPAFGNPSLSASPSRIGLGGTLGLATDISGGETPYTFVWAGLPRGCPAMNAASISCVPSVTGDYNVSVQVTDATGVVSPRAFTVVEVNATLSSVVLQSSPATLELGQSSDIRVGSVGNNSTVSWQWEGLPGGCVPSGTNFTCTPTATGTYAVEVSGTLPGQTPVLSNVVVLTVLPRLGTASLVASVSSFVAGTSFTLSAIESGGAPPYAYSWSGLPTGCAPGDSPVLSCTPTAPGSYGVSVNVSDPTGAYSNASLSVVVNPAPAKSPSTNTTTTSPSGGGGSFDWTPYFLALIIAVLGAALVVAMIIRHREEMEIGRRPPRLPPPQGPGVPEPGAPAGSDPRGTPADVRSRAYPAGVGSTPQGYRAVPLSAAARQELSTGRA